MSSGSLPLGSYHRASALGEGTYGSVVTVYDDDGAEFALKLFDEDEDESDSEDDAGCMSLGALREISLLRVLRDDNGHPNIVRIHDVKPMGDEEQGGGGTDGFVGIAMPLFRGGTLKGAIDSGALGDRAGRVGIAHGLLSALAFLHNNGVIHRDVKPDNVMLERGDGDGDGPSSVRPVLIDFSLAKLVDTSMYGDSDLLTFGAEDGTTHTPETGTPTYRAPEVAAGDTYGTPSDLWSAGVVLLEMIRGGTLEVEKDRGAMRIVEGARRTLPDQPFPNLVRGLLEEDAGRRTSAWEALECPLFGKFGLTVDGRTTGRISLRVALPFNGDADGEVGDESTQPQTTNGRKAPGKTPRKGKPRIDPALARRMRMIQRLCNQLDFRHPLTRQAALCYARQMEELDDTLDDITESQVLPDCVVLAAKFFEEELPDLNELDECESGDFAKWSLDEYRDNETTIWTMLDFCLYPRKLVEWER